MAVCTSSPRSTLRKIAFSRSNRSRFSAPRRSVASASTSRVDAAPSIMESCISCSRSLASLISRRLDDSSMLCSCSRLFSDLTRLYLSFSAAALARSARSTASAHLCSASAAALHAASSCSLRLAMRARSSSCISIIKPRASAPSVALRRWPGLPCGRMLPSPVGDGRQASSRAPGRGGCGCKITGGGGTASDGGAGRRGVLVLE